MVLLYSRYVIVNGESVRCKLPQNEGLQKIKIKMNKKNMNYPVKISRYVRWWKAPHRKELFQFFFFFPADDSIWSIDVNELELICFKFPLKVNW